jgi:chromosome condensin MukBEF MukE localization factor
MRDRNDQAVETKATEIANWLANADFPAVGSRLKPGSGRHVAPRELIQTLTVSFLGL